MNEANNFVVNIQAVNEFEYRNDVYPKSFEGNRNPQEEDWLSYDHIDGTRVIMQRFYHPHDERYKWNPLKYDKNAPIRAGMDVLIIKGDRYIYFQTIEGPHYANNDMFSIIQGDKDGCKEVYSSRISTTGREDEAIKDALEGDLKNTYSQYIPKKFDSMMRIIETFKTEPNKEDRNFEIKEKQEKMNEINKKFFESRRVR